MRGCGHKDLAATEARHFQHRDSYVSVSINPHSRKPAEYLAGADLKARYKEVWKRDGKRCVLCDRDISKEGFEPDHHPDRSKGGDDSLACLRSLCSWCHRLGSEAKHK